jgi:hypothetical protein
MSGGDWAGLLGGVAVLLGALGTGFKWLVGILLKEAHDTIRQKNEEIRELRIRIALLEQKDGGR